MQTIKVNKSELLATVQKNRALHAEIVTEALANYRAAAIEELDRMIQEARGGKHIRRALTLVEPVDQTADYDSAIRKLEMSVDDVIEIDDESFRQLVMDQWAWKRQFKTANLSYSRNERLYLKD